MAAEIIHQLSVWIRVYKYRSFSSSLIMLKFPTQVPGSINRYNSLCLFWRRTFRCEQNFPTKWSATLILMIFTEPFAASTLCWRWRRKKACQYLERNSTSWKYFPVREVRLGLISILIKIPQITYGPLSVYRSTSVLLTPKGLVYKAHQEKPIHLSLCQFGLNFVQSSADITTLQGGTNTSSSD